MPIFIFWNFGVYFMNSCASLECGKCAEIDSSTKISKSVIMWALFFNSYI